MKKIRDKVKERKLIKDTEKKISEEIYCIAESILEIETVKTKGKIRGVVHKYIMKRFAREKRLRKFGLDLDVKLEMETEMKEATFTLSYK